MADLTIENEYRPRTDARWIRLRCQEPGCLLVEAYVEPAARADAMITAVRVSHSRMHADDATQDGGQA